MCETCGCTVTGNNTIHSHSHPHRDNSSKKNPSVKNDKPEDHQPELSDAGKSFNSDNKEAIHILKNLLTENDHQAEHNRFHFKQNNVLTINLMSSPGAGKTRLLEVTLKALMSKYSLAVIEGDLETENDARRIRALGVEAIQICTGSGCHLDAHMVHNALHQLDLAKLDILFIENVGNLVCPASFDLGQHFNIALLSVPEGDDKPAKYPVMFRAADRVLISKSDLLSYLQEFSVTVAENTLRQLASTVPLQLISSKSGEGITDWLEWLQVEVGALQRSLPRVHLDDYVEKDFKGEFHDTGTQANETLQVNNSDVYKTGQNTTGRMDR